MRFCKIAEVSLSNTYLGKEQLLSILPSRPCLCYTTENTAEHEMRPVGQKILVQWKPLLCEKNLRPLPPAGPAAGFLRQVETDSPRLSL